MKKYHRGDQKIMYSELLEERTTQCSSFFSDADPEVLKSYLLTQMKQLVKAN